MKLSKILGLALVLVSPMLNSCSDDDSTPSYGERRKEFCEALNKDPNVAEMRESLNNTIGQGIAEAVRAEGRDEAFLNDWFKRYISSRFYRLTQEEAKTCYLYFWNKFPLDRGRGAHDFPVVRYEDLNEICKEFVDGFASEESARAFYETYVRMVDFDFVETFRAKFYDNFDGSFACDQIQKHGEKYGISFSKEEAIMIFKEIFDGFYNERKLTPLEQAQMRFIDAATLDEVFHENLRLTNSALTNTFIETDKEWYLATQGRILAMQRELAQSKGFEFTDDEAVSCIEYLRIKYLIPWAHLVEIGSQPISMDQLSENVQAFLNSFDTEEELKALGGTPSNWNRNAMVLKFRQSPRYQEGMDFAVSHFVQDAASYGMEFTEEESKLLLGEYFQAYFEVATAQGV